MLFWDSYPLPPTTYTIPVRENSEIMVRLGNLRDFTLLGTTLNLLSCLQKSFTDQLDVIHGYMDTRGIFL